MSMADDIEYEPDNAQEICYAFDNKDWVSKTGKVFNIEKMETSHIANCLNKCIKDNWRTQYISIFKNELERRKNEML